MLLTTCTSYCPRRAVEQQGYSMHKPTGLPAQISAGLLAMVQAPTQRGCYRNPLAWQIILKSYSFSPELSLHP